jgi:hypothetical protein
MGSSDIGPVTRRPQDIGAVSTSVTSVNFYRSALRNIPEDSHTLEDALYVSIAVLKKQTFLSENKVSILVTFALCFDRGLGTSCTVS